jgi:hypothetical protein
MLVTMGMSNQKTKILRVLRFFDGLMDPLLTQVLLNRVHMDIKLEHTSIIDKKNQLLCSSHKGDIQFFSVS